MTDPTLDGAFSALSLDDSPVPVKVDPDFASDEGDLILVSCDGVKFKFFKDRLSAKSGMFRDMFEVVGSEGEDDGVAEVPMTEQSEVVKKMLAFCRDEYDVSLTSRGDLPWNVIKAFDKYDIKFDFARLATELETKSAGLYNKNPATLVGRYLLALCHNKNAVSRAVKDIISSELPWSQLSAQLEELHTYDLTDGGQLKRLFDRRRATLECKRNELYRYRVSRHYIHLAQSGKVTESGLKWCLEAWEGSENITTLSELEKYDSARRPRPQRGCFFHYNALRMILEALPTELR